MDRAGVLRRFEDGDELLVEAAVELRLEGRDSRVARRFGPDLQAKLALLLMKALSSK